MPLTMFKACARELGTNYIDYSSRQIVVNLTWMQNFAGKVLQSCLDPETVAKQVFSNVAAEPDLLKFICPS